MNPVKKTIFISKKKDEDILSLYHQLGRKDFVLLVKDALRSLVRPGYTSTLLGKKGIYPIENVSENRSYEFDESGNLYLALSFGPDSDGDVLGVLKNVKKGCLSRFVLMAVRICVGPYYSLGFYLEGDSKLCDRYKDRQLFFVVSEGLVQKARQPRVTVQASEKPAKKRATQKTEPVQVVPAHQEVAQIIEPVPDKEGSLTVAPLVDSGNANLSEDDILSILENM